MKGVFGKTLTLLISLLLAVLALVLIWQFHEQLIAFFGDILLEGLKNFICDIPGINAVCKVGGLASGVIP